MELQIPEAFDRILKTDATLHGAVMLSVAEFEPWLRLSGTPFFPEYTDHSLKHITETIATASAIIRDEAWPIITAADVATLVLSILLHDSAMHLGDDGFTRLVDPVGNRPTVEGLDDKPWPTLWLDFLGEASRFDARKLYSLFGDTEPSHNPGLEPKTWTARDRLLIGEFIRRHHGRLAHEISLRGVPGPSGKSLHLKDIPGAIADIVGLIARSHGQSIRSCLEYLKRYDVREFKVVHAVFLMTLVRVSDYLQIHSGRAPEQILRIHRLRSPVSQGEWKAHEAVRDIRNTHEDPEAIFVDAAPRDVKTYLKLRRLLAGIQEEMDSSWAVLGEIYGRYDGLKQFGLRLRRVRSSLDAEKEFAATVPYIPCEAKFEAADADLLNLLIKPLYGDHPEVAVRELVQNAVDACRELRDYLEQRPDIRPSDIKGKDADVMVRLQEGTEEGTGWLEVTDSGIGMTSDTVRKYFLKAGASFRRSDAWRKLHESGPGKSRVLRSGRFGIGVLASFLLGDAIQVSTRHVDSAPEEGISFEATMASTEIELRRSQRAVGTSVRINISDKKVWNALARWDYRGELNPYSVDGWDWYSLADPTVTRTVESKAKTTLLKQKFTLPAPKSSLAGPWHRVSHADYADIQWTFGESPELVCNGIRVLEQFGRNDSPIENLWQQGHEYRRTATLKCPNISVFDPDGHLPLSLQRTGLAASRFPFHEELLEGVVKDLLAFILTNAPQRNVSEPSVHDDYRGIYPGFGGGWRKWLPFFCLANGTSFVDFWHLRAVTFTRAIVAPSLRVLPAILTDSRLNPPGITIGLKLESGLQDQRAWFRTALGRSSDADFGPVSQLKREGCRMLISKRAYDGLKPPGMIAKFYWDAITEEFSKGDWVLLRSGKCPDISLDFNKLARGGDPNIDGLAEWYLPANQPADNTVSPIAKAWQEILGPPVIPFDLNKRRKQFGRAYNELKDYIAVQERLRDNPKKANG
jgi:hypothetical protein